MDIKNLSEKQLRRLSRRDLLIIMIEQAKQIERLEKSLEKEKSNSTIYSSPKE